jgi:hypothetical protein
MSKLVLTKTKMRQGVWEGLLSGATTGTTPRLLVTHQGNLVPDVAVTAVEADAGHAVRIPIPQDAISDGMQTLLVTDAEDNTQLASITLMAGEALGDDLRVEVDLLRAELDMLKRAFRRHCLETS